jgi:hypothetical protein
MLVGVAVACTDNKSKDDQDGGNGDGDKPKIEVTITGGADSIQVGDTTSYYEASISNATEGEIEWGWKTVLSVDLVSDFGTFSDPDSNRTTFTATKAASSATIMAYAVYQGETYEAFALINITEPEPEQISQVRVGHRTVLLS